MSEGTAKRTDQDFPKQRRIQTVRGVRDILPPETALWSRVEQDARQVFGKHGFGEIRPPVFEPTELFARSIGSETDVVSKEMYSFPDHGLWALEGMRTDLLLRTPDWSDPYSVQIFVRMLDSFIEQSSLAVSQGDMPKTPDNERAIEQLRAASDRISSALVPQTSGMSEQSLSLLIEHIHTAAALLKFGDLVSLRPEATASVCRAYIEHSMQQLPQPIQMYYMGPMFRRDRPQKGRYRQFYQIGAEVLGPSVHFATDAQVIAMLMEFFELCGVLGHTLFINSIGCQDCRPAYVALLRRELLKIRGKLSADSQRRIDTNPLRVLDSKVPQDQEQIARLPMITQYLCKECADDYESLKTVLASRGVPFKENPRLVRGLDYYTRTTFEVVARGLGAQDAICGGGRYDGLVELLGGPKFSRIKGIGFAIGEDRLIDVIKDSGRYEGVSRAEVYVAWMGEESKLVAEDLARLLRRNGVSVEVPTEELKLRKSLDLAYRRGARYALIVGADEVTTGRFTLKRLSDAAQRKVTEAELYAAIKQWET